MLLLGIAFGFLAAAALVSLLHVMAARRALCRLRREHASMCLRIEEARKETLRWRMAATGTSPDELQLPLSMRRDVN